jgi:membrane protein DedA with SNARE-associated domain
LGSRRYVAGAIVEPQTVYELGRDWYATRLDDDWQPAAVAEAQAMFEKHGLRGPFWALA